MDPWIKGSGDPGSMIHGDSWIHGSNGHGSMDPEIQGSMDPWIHGSMDPGIHGSMDPRIHGYSGSMDPWIRGSLDPVDPWIQASLDPWIQISAKFTLGTQMLAKSICPELILNKSELDSDASKNFEMRRRPVSAAQSHQNKKSTI